MNEITLSIIIPAYNEEKRIGKTLNIISSFLYSQKINFEIIVVANNCSDNTVDILNNIKNKSIPEIVIIDIPKEGMVGNMKGFSISVGMRKAIGKHHLFIDADNATCFNSVIKFINYIDEGYGVVIGSRYIKDSFVVKKQPLYRIILSRLSNLLIRIVLLPGIYDTQCGFKMFSLNASKDIFSKTTINGWGADLEMLAIAHNLGYKIKEAPIRWESQDESTVRSHAFLYTLKELFVIRKNVDNNLYK
jgi:glycosyltransferase involved in cell wall biosynthesis